MLAYEKIKEFPGVRDGQTKWQRSYRDCVSPLWFEWLAMLGAYDRLVLWFDS